MAEDATADEVTGRKVRFVRAELAEEPSAADAATGRYFPGGRVRLPRITDRYGRPLRNSDTATPPGAPPAGGSEPRRGEQPSVRFVGTAFVRPDPTRPADPSARRSSGGFDEYYTYASLFDDRVDDPPPAPTAEEQALRTLGLPPGASWPEVVAAHRHLVKETHPDLLVGQDPIVIEEATERLRAVNLAYAQLRSTRRPSRGD